ncbi:MAG: histidine--tRNA ligase [Clostridia bacterium]|nr:histidine--tRNA ligase [Clostridia bacterium]
MLLTQAPKGTQDVLPQDSYRWQDAERIMRETCAKYGFREARTPVFEHTELFLRGVGDTTDVVQKEMYTFMDKGNRSITLKPEGTAGIARMFLENKIYAQALPSKIYYVSCPVFRYEKPQAGRLREHHQMGVEVFGAADASCDAEVISLADELLRRYGIGGVKLMINSIGCPECRKAYNDVLKAYLRPKLHALCDTCRDRFERNPLRILDCKEKKCQAELTDAPSMLDCLCDGCREHFEKLKKYLAALEIPYEIDSRIVRGLDYYTRTVFEFVTQTPAGKLTVCGGGRYDGLVEQLGGPATPGMGFGMGVERLIMTQDACGVAPKAPRLYDAFVIAVQDEAREAGMKLVRELRGAGVNCDMDHAARSLKAQFKYADKQRVGLVVIIGPDELENGVVKLRDMATGEEENLDREVAVAKITGRIKTEESYVTDRI